MFIVKIGEHAWTCFINSTLKYFNADVAVFRKLYIKHRKERVLFSIKLGACYSIKLETDKNTDYHFQKSEF